MFQLMIIKGNLDFILTKPINSQFLLSLRYVGFNGLVNLFFLSVLFLTIAISNLQDFSFKIETDKEQHVHQKPKKIAINRN